VKTVHLGSLRLDGTVPRVAVPFRDGVPAERIAEARRLGMDIAELRVDLFATRQPDALLAEVERYGDVPVLVTIRSAAEGGEWDDSDEDRLALYHAVLPHVAAVDVELSSSAIVDAVVRAAHEERRCAIVSFHDFERTPASASLDDIARRAHDLGADIIKVAAMCRTPDDVRTLGEFTIRHRDKGLVTIGMGAVGLLSRVFFPALGSLFTFASFGEGTAVGQIPLEETRAYLRKFYPPRASEGD